MQEPSIDDVTQVRGGGLYFGDTRCEKNDVKNARYNILLDEWIDLRSNETFVQNIFVSF